MGSALRWTLVLACIQTLVAQRGGSIEFINEEINEVIRSSPTLYSSSREQRKKETCSIQAFRITFFFSLYYVALMQYLEYKRKTSRYAPKPRYRVSLLPPPPPNPLIPSLLSTQDAQRLVSFLYHGSGPGSFLLLHVSILPFLLLRCLRCPRSALRFSYSSLLVHGIRRLGSGNLVSLLSRL